MPEWLGLCPRLPLQSHARVPASWCSTRRSSRGRGKESLQNSEQDAEGGRDIQDIDFVKLEGMLSRRIATELVSVFA